VPGIVGFGVAAELAAHRLEIDRSHFSHLRQLVLTILRGVDSVDVLTDDLETGQSAPVAPNTVSVRFRGADAEAVLANAPRVAVSAGSACSAGVPGASHVLRAMLGDGVAASECIRISLGRTTTSEEVERGLGYLLDAVHRVRSMT
jgi:cysteine desulfurase